MTIEKKIRINLTPRELAQEFCDMTDFDQAMFFAAIKGLSDGWPNSGWCGQAHHIVRHANDDARSVLGALADHLKAGE